MIDDIRPSSTIWLVAYMVICLSVSALFLRPQPRAQLPYIDRSELASRVEVLRFLGVSDFVMRRARVPEGAWGALGEFDQLLEKNGLSYSKRFASTVDFEKSTVCDDVKFRLSSSSFDGLMEVRVSIDDNWAAMSRLIPVSDKQGTILGYIHPVRNDKNADSLLFPLLIDEWKGYVYGEKGSKETLYLHYNILWEGRKSCQL